MGDVAVWQQLYPMMDSELGPKDETRSAISHAIVPTVRRSVGVFFVGLLLLLLLLLLLSLLLLLLAFYLNFFLSLPLVSFAPKCSQLSI